MNIPLVNESFRRTNSCDWEEIGENEFDLNFEDNYILINPSDLQTDNKAEMYIDLIKRMYFRQKYSKEIELNHIIKSSKQTYKYYKKIREISESNKIYGKLLTIYHTPSNRKFLDKILNNSDKLSLLC